MKNLWIYCSCCLLLLNCTKPEIYENRNIWACGINDPVHNIAWLNDYCQTIHKQKDISSVYIHLYQTIGVDEFFFRFEICKKSNKDRYFITYRNCNGEIVHEKIQPIARQDGPNYMPPAPDTWLDDKEFIARLFSYVK
ncbi:MAG: hypothetical protein K2O01_08875 [Bacteroidales bacterium]|nr:hypothetical protein [Bacteroidales bacterium]